MASNTINGILTVAFAIEAALKIISFGFCLGEGAYLRDTWNQMDFFIVVTSLVDMAVSGIDIPFIKVLRTLRTLRPLRFITHNINMKIVVTALMHSLTAIFNVLIVLFLIFLMFAILGMSLMQGKMGYCNVENYFEISKEQCLSQGY